MWVETQDLVVEKPVCASHAVMLSTLTLTEPNTQDWEEGSHFYMTDPLGCVGFGWPQARPSGEKCAPKELELR